MVTEAIIAIMDPSVMLFMLIGVIVGALIGALPGLSVVMAISILTPITFGLKPAQGLAMLIGVYNSGVWAGGISAILVNTPGTPASIMTSLDGYAMTKRGEAGLALGINVIYSAIGGLISSVILMIAAFPIAKFALKFGPAEYFALSLFGLSMIIGVSEKSILKGVMMGCFGFLIATVGLDSMYAYPRYTFGMVDLLQGISYVPVMIGLFGFAEVLGQVYENKKDERDQEKKKIGRIIPTWKMVKDFFPLTTISALVSVIVGAIPGAGGDIASIICWDQCKKVSKDKENYGKGSAEGLAVTCTANNGIIGGAMTTMLTLGIPGDAVTAVLIGSLMMYGMQPGPMLFVESKDFVYKLMVMMVIANIMFLVFGLMTSKASAALLKLKEQYVWVAIILLSIVGSYAVNNSIFDVVVMFICGIIGFFLKKYDFPLPPLILGLILGPMAESNLRRSLALSAGSYQIFIASPISIVLLACTVLALAGPVIMKKMKTKKEAEV
ncbi:tripartite tricarboxylate transporter permease [Lachnoclostridium edouardi]|uniref:tripartite tricarboxylate transporter permease n=1 Tax=Lachnoclostridium edouardi TaxID=1926283 RepID=UPI000C7C7B85|nr:tripartite tricarboxylate transporter permease [Lachnoclostridium edouardi]